MNKISPSSLCDLAKCPSFKHQESSSLAANIGKACHLAVETGDTRGLTEDQISWVTWCIDERDKLIDLCRIRDPDIIVRSEYKIPLLEGMTNGILDCLIVSPQTNSAIILDYKFGVLSVEDCRTNLQGFSYVIGLLGNHPEISTVMVQFWMARRQEIDSAVFERADEDRLFDEVLKIYKEVNSEIPIYRPGEFCRWCKSTTSCPATLQVVKYFGNNLLVENNKIPDDLELCSPSIRANLLASIPILEAWIDKAKKSNLKAIMDGMEIPGYKLFKRQGARTIRDNEVLLEYLDSVGLTAKDLLPIATIGINKLQKIISADIFADLDARGIMTRGDSVYYIVKK